MAHYASARRVGSLPDSLPSQIDQLSVEGLGEALLDFTELADLQSLLRTYRQREKE